ncbi:MAG: hypothetical protein RML75_11665 [Cyanobacteriota bacterium SKYGB_h_bin112]|nr:hypothetical protein [Cyanobacteriota bacterium SKYGB_h_bin112]
MVKFHSGQVHSGQISQPPPRQGNDRLQVCRIPYASFRDHHPARGLKPDAPCELGDAWSHAAAAL